MLVETLAQYSALMVMEHDVRRRTRCGASCKYELDRYLRARGSSARRSCRSSASRTSPTSTTARAPGDVRAAGLHRRGRVNRALAKLIKEHAYEGAPHLLSSDLVQAFRAAAPAQYRPLIGDMFEKIVLFQNHALAAKADKRSDGKYDVHVKVSCKKMEVDNSGFEKERPLDEWIDVGVLDAKDQPLALERKHIDKPEMEFAFVVAGEPARAGIDPLVKLIDRKWEDNTVAVEK